MKKKIISILAITLFITASILTGCADHASATETLSSEELYEISGGDAEYWKYYDAEGNPIDRKAREESITASIAADDATREESTTAESEMEDELLDYFNGGDAGSFEWYQEHYGNVDTQPETEVELKTLINNSYYLSMADELSVVEIYEAQDLTYDILANRNGKVIIEYVLGQVLDSEGNGKQLNPSVKENDYICYSSVPDAEIGDIILTVFVYDPNTNAEDAIELRSDWIVDKTTVQ